MKTDPAALDTDQHIERASDDEAHPGVRRVTVARVTTALAALLVLLALITPDELGHLTPGGFVSIPVEGLLGVLLVIGLPPRARRVAAGFAGAVLGLLTVMKLLDLGFGVALARPFDPISDWPLLGAAEEFLTASFGRAGAIAAVVCAAAVAIAVPVLMMMSVLRLTRVATRRRTAALRAVAVLAVAWISFAAFGAHVVPGVPIAGWNTTAVAYDHAVRARAELKDRKAFARDVAADAYRHTPADQLLNGLRGKDVIIAFVESYGRDAVENPAIAPQVDAVLEAGSRRLAAAGFSARSAFLTSSTIGGSSWLPHATLQSGLWVDSQRRYGDFITSDRRTLASAFHAAGWRTVAVMPATTRDWPEGAIYGYDEIYDARNLGYRGPTFSFSSPPDQYTLSAFHRSERATPGHPPVMAEIDLLSSHAPWEPIPEVVDWADIGDGSGYGATSGPADPPESVSQRDLTVVRGDYGRSIEYSLNSLISYVETYGDDNLVLILLGDHQPAPIITGTRASRDVPITVVARDPAAFDRISGWGWQEGMNPDPQAPTWRMDAFRDRFFAAFGR
jgi:hypothetical protein